MHHGYPAHLPMAGGHVAANPIAFFPLFPLLVRAIDLTGLPAGVVGARAQRRHRRDRRLRRRASWPADWPATAPDCGPRCCFAVFPGTFAFSLAYSEGIVITCVSLGLLALLDRRWWLAGVLGAVATAASPVALAFVVSCLWCAGRSRAQGAPARRTGGPAARPARASWPTWPTSTATPGVWTPGG